MTVGGLGAGRWPTTLAVMADVAEAARAAGGIDEGAGAPAEGRDAG